MRAFIPSFVILLFLLGCSVSDPDTRPGVDVNVRVVYTDRDTINAKAREYGYTSQANGFYTALLIRYGAQTRRLSRRFVRAGMS